MITKRYGAFLLPIQIVYMYTCMPQHGENNSSQKTKNVIVSVATAKIMSMSSCNF